MMIMVEHLRQYRENVKLLDRVKGCLSGEQKSSDKPSEIKGVRKGNVIYYTDMNCMGTVCLLAEQSRLEKENKHIKSYIDSIPKGRVQQALFHYCIDEKLDCPTWDDVARLMNESDSDSLRAVIEDYLSEQPQTFF